MYRITKVLKHAVRLAGIVLFFYAEFVLLGSVYWGAHAGLHEELPLGDIEGIIISDSGEIYVGLQSYARIQVYDCEGHFLRGFPTYGGPFEFRLVDTQAEVVVTYAYTTKILNAHSGKIVKKLDQSDSSITSDNVAYDAEDNRYELADWSWLWPRIQRVSPQGEESIVVRQPWTLWIRQTPSPAYHLATFGLVLALSTHLPEIKQQFRDYINKRAMRKSSECRPGLVRRVVSKFLNLK
jgi:hypothetical protein